MEETGLARIEPLFWRKVHKTRKCWEWTGKLSVKGYGIQVVDDKHKTTHRLSWRLAHGDIPDGLCVLHKCDNRKCVRPAHLFLGTQQDNIRDMVAKRRQRGCKGTENGRCKLTEKDVRAIRKSKLGHSELGRQYGVKHSTIRNIRLGLLWKHVA